ncbi:MAG: hypothetical protein DRQ88_00485 [Epsilonproteobacteria bacterium]|nr:MAG: hypothetical protein DRQ89_03565 [Campylobacterota bacterium]RLA68113.1 MAG: hypothetical protein DRQ88_00485 [Campylobacterota bacterium]
MQIKSRLLISKILVILAIALYCGTYLLGPMFAYMDPITDEVEFDEDNLSFQPLPFLVEKGTETRPSPQDIKKYIGPTQFEYFPEGIWGYVIGYHTMPIWRVSLEAPQYPKASYPQGIPVYFTLTDFRGKVVEMNVINHYIGMDPMDIGAFKMRQLAPFLVLIAVLCLIISLFYEGKGWWILTLAPATFPWVYMGTYIYWLYWFGHNLHPYGAFTIKPFMPTVLGTGKVAQFHTYSYPAAGFYFLFIAFLFLVLATLIKRRALKEKSVALI